jgi:hypothetical protein
MVIVGVVFFREQRAGVYVQVVSVKDGDTIVVERGKTVRLLGINASESGQQNAILAKEYLRTLLDGKRVWLEYQGFNRDLAWVWVGCENRPRFLFSYFFVKNRKAGSAGLRRNPAGCREGVLVNEQIIKMGWLKTSF